jgi:hypothetical protein
MACFRSNPHFCGGNSPAERCGPPAGSATCRHWPAGSSNTIGSAYGDDPAWPIHHGCCLRADSTATGCRRCRRAAPVGRRRARSSEPPSRTRRAARGRTRPRPKPRNHAPRPARRRDSRAPRPAPTHPSLRSECETSRGLHHIPRPTRSCGHSPAVGRHDPEAGSGERRHHLSPGVGEFREAMQEENQRPAACLESGLQHMHSQPVDVAHKPGSYAGWKNIILQRRQLGHFHLS